MIFVTLEKILRRVTILIQHNNMTNDTNLSKFELRVVFHGNPYNFLNKQIIFRFKNLIHLLHHIKMTHKRSNSLATHLLNYIKITFL